MLTTGCRTPPRTQTAAPSPPPRTGDARGYVVVLRRSIVPKPIRAREARFNPRTKSVARALSYQADKGALRAHISAHLILDAVRCAPVVPLRRGAHRTASS